MIRAGALVLTATTGFSGLAREAVWQKYLATLLGSHSEATAAMLENAQTVTKEFATAYVHASLVNATAPFSLWASCATDSAGGITCVAEPRRAESLLSTGQRE